MLGALRRAAATAVRSYPARTGLSWSARKLVPSAVCSPGGCWPLVAGHERVQREQFESLLLAVCCVKGPVEKYPLLVVDL